RTWAVLRSSINLFQSVDKLLWQTLNNLISFLTKEAKNRQANRHITPHKTTVIDQCNLQTIRCCRLRCNNTCRSAANNQYIHIHTNRRLSRGLKNSLYFSHVELL